MGEGDGEVMVVVVEGAGGGEAGGGEEGGEAGFVELVAVFGVDGFALRKADGFAGEVDGLGVKAFEVHLDARGGGVPAGAVGEGVEVEVGAEFAVEAGEDVFVEGGGDAGGVVIGGEEGGDGFTFAGGEVGAEEEGVAGREMGAEVAEDSGGFGWARSCRCWSRCRGRGRGGLETLRLRGA